MNCNFVRIFNKLSKIFSKFTDSLCLKGLIVVNSIINFQNLNFMRLSSIVALLGLASAKFDCTDGANGMSCIEDAETDQLDIYCKTVKFHKFGVRKAGGMCDIIKDYDKPKAYQKSLGKMKCW